MHTATAILRSLLSKSSHAGAGRYTAQSYARDFAVFGPFIRSHAPDMRIVGPGSVGEELLTAMPGSANMSGVSTEAMLSAAPRPWRARTAATRFA